MCIVCIGTCHAKAMLTIVVSKIVKSLNQLLSLNGPLFRVKPLMSTKERDHLPPFCPSLQPRSCGHLIPLLQSGWLCHPGAVQRGRAALVDEPERRTATLC